MKLIFALLFSLNASASLLDVPYTFDQQKLSVTQDSFHFLRTYVDYFYLEFKANRSSFPVLSGLSDQAGWCAGDAHPENYGALLQSNGTSIFGLNDIDDAGPCPVILDLARLMISSRLYKGSINLDDLLKAYRHGLEGDKVDMPQEVSDLLQDSQKKGERPEHSRVNGNTLIRSPLAQEVSPSELAQLASSLRPLSIVDAMETSKVGGGSGGLRRFEVLAQANDGLIALEFKQEIVPSIYPVATSPIPDLMTRMKQTLLLEQGPKFSTYDTAVVIDGQPMIVRPRFAGNVGVSLDANKKKENFDIIGYEAVVLGEFHSRSIDGNAWSARLKQVDFNALATEIEAFAQFIDQKYSSLKAN